VCGWARRRAVMRGRCAPHRTLALRARPGVVAHPSPASLTLIALIPCPTPHLPPFMQMGMCFSSPDADKPAASSKQASKAGAHGSAAAAAAKARVPDFGLAEFWEVIKLLGTGECARCCCGCHCCWFAAAGPESSGKLGACMQWQKRGVEQAGRRRPPLSSRSIVNSNQPAGCKQHRRSALTRTHGPRTNPHKQAARARRGCAASTPPAARWRSSWCGAPSPSPSRRSSSGRSASWRTWEVSGRRRLIGPHAPLMLTRTEPEHLV